MNKNKFSKIFQSIKPSPMLQMFEAANKYDDMINLGIGEPDFHTDENIIDAACKAGKQGFTHYTPVQGFQDLREKIVEYWMDKYKLYSSPDEVMVTVGAIQAIYLSLQTMINPGDEVIVTDPCFTPYLQQIEYLHGKAVSVPVYEKNHFNLTADDLTKYITDQTKILLLNSPCNPTGAVMEKEGLIKIAEVVEKYDLMVISDEVYESFIFQGNHVPFATLPGMKERTFTIAGFSKTYAMTGWRVGYAICPNQKAADVMKIISIASTMCVNSLAQKAALYALQNGQDKANEMINIYKERINFAAKRINSIPNISCIKPKGSFYIFVNITKTGMNSLEFAWEILEKAHVIVIPGISFGKNGDGYVRIACTVPIEMLNEAFNRIENVLKKKIFPATASD